MNKNLRFCYRADKKLGLAEDEFGNPGEAYFSIMAKDVNRYDLEESEYKDLQDGFKTLIASTLECDKELLTPITINEYLDKTGTEI